MAVGRAVATNAENPGITPRNAEAEEDTLTEPSQFTLKATKTKLSQAFLADLCLRGLLRGLWGLR